MKNIILAIFATWLVLVLAISLSTRFGSAQHIILVLFVTGAALGSVLLRPNSRKK